MHNRRCPRCHTNYSAPARFCVRDGSPLVEVSEPAVPVPVSRSVPDADEPPEVDAEVRRRYSTLSGQTLDARYRIIRKVGEGGMSFVYQGEEIGTGRSVALKVLTPRLSRDPGSVERLKREASIAMRFAHPNVCPILSVSQTPEGTLYLVMPFLPGEALSDAEAQKGTFSVEEGLPILAQSCRGLQHAHDLGIVHRDLKPENIMLVPDEREPGGVRAVVMDFGLAKQRRAGADLARLTQTGIVLGTPEFMSPEQIRGKLLDGRSDIYAMGVLAFEMFTGRLPFNGKNAQETMLARLRGKPEPIRNIRAELPARLEAAIARALQINPADRQGSMAELAHAFETASEASGVFARLFGK